MSTLGKGGRGCMEEGGLQAGTFSTVRVEFSGSGPAEVAENVAKSASGNWLVQEKFNTFFLDTKTKSFFSQKKRRWKKEKNKAKEREKKASKRQTRRKETPG